MSATRRGENHKSMKFTQVSLAALAFALTTPASGQDETSAGQVPDEESAGGIQEIVARLIIA